MDEPLRLLEAFEPATGGVPELVRGLAGGLAHRGHDVVVAGPAAAAARASIEASGARYVALDWRAEVPAPRADLAVARELRALIRAHRPQVVHAHGQKAGLLARPVAALQRVPSVYTPHSLVYRTQLARPRRGQRARLLVHRQVERSLGRVTALVAGCSETEARTAVADGLVPPSRAAAIVNGVAPDLAARPHRALAGVPGDGPLVGFVGTLREQKGLPDLLSALEVLAQRGTPVRCAIVGSGPMADEVERRAAGPLLRCSTVLLPYDGAVEPYLAGLDVFVLPSLWEGLSLAILEAMAFGLPVVATAVDGTPEAVADGRTGLLVPPGDPLALAGALERVVSDAGLRRSLGLQGRLVAAERFTIDRTVRDAERVYRRVLGDRASATS